MKRTETMSPSAPYKMKSLSRVVLRELSNLPTSPRAKASTLFGRLTSSGFSSEDAPEPIAEISYALAIDDDYAIVYARADDSPVCVALHVGRRDVVVNWARQHYCELNPQTGSIQVYNPEPSRPAPASQSSSKPARGLFDAISDADLLALGLPERQLAFARSLTSVAELTGARDDFSPDVYEPLLDLTDGEALDAVLRRVRARSTPSRDFADSLENNDATRQYFFAPSGEEDLKRALAEPLAQWRVFLHPDQRRLAYETNFRGPARVLGGAGTGKTVVAMHRAKYLAGRAPKGVKILFTTFTKNLAEDIKENLRSICQPEELEKIDVVNIDAWVAGYLKKRRIATRLVYGDELREIWKEAIDFADGTFDVEFYQEEYARVVAANDAFSEALYMTAPRVGRRTRLDRKKRREVWKVFEEFQTRLSSRRVRDFHTAAYECRRFLDTDPGERYQHIIVDETQDLSSSALRLLRALAGPEHDDDLFLVGDAHQRIYKTVAPLSKCGINIRGRSSKLRVCYRTTEEVRRAAFSLLKGIPFDDLDDSFDDENYRSLTQGAKPVVKNFANPADEKDYVLAQVNQASREFENGVAEICVVARTKELVDQWRDFFNDRDFETYKIETGQSENRARKGLRFATMHRVKGLEFQYVFVVSANADVVPPFKDDDPEVTEEDRIAEKSLLYVALTRARKNVFITSSGRESAYLAVLNDENDA